MIIILGLIILIAAVITGAAGVLGNTGSGYALSHPFTMLGYHVTGSASTHVRDSGSPAARPPPSRTTGAGQPAWPARGRPT